MSDRDSATLNLSSLLRHDPGSGDEVEGTGEFTPDPAWHSEELRFEGPLSYRLNVRSAGGDDFVVSGDVRGEAVLPCRRCLKDVEVPSRSDFIYAMEYRPGSGDLEMLYDNDEEDELLVFGQPQVDFAQMLTEIFSVDLPLAAECPEGVSCERLADTYAEHNDHPHESPFAKLKDFEAE